MLITVLEVIGMIAMFLGMCMEDCNTAAGIVQIALVVGGAVAAFIGYKLEVLKYERKQTDLRVKEIRRRSKAS